MTPRALLDAARSLLDDADDRLPGAWPRAVALLVRQALEALVDEAVPESLGRAPFAVRLLWVRRHGGDPDRAERLAATWSALSEACHFHGYELPPTATSLRGWIGVVDAASAESAGGGVDDVQRDLIAWRRDGDDERGDRAMRAIAGEWRGRIRRFLRSPPAEEVDDVLHDAMLALCNGASPRVLAPDDVRSARAWRAKVLRNFLHDRRRKLDRRRHAEWAAAHGLTPATERAVWRGDLPRTSLVPVPVAADDEDPLQRLLVERRRAEVVRRAYGLAVRRAALVLLALRADLEPLVPELARALDDTVDRVAERVRRALTSEHDGAHPYLSLAMVRVLHPDAPEAKALEAARKGFSRAVHDLRAACAESA